MGPVLLYHWGAVWPFALAVSLLPVFLGGLAILCGIGSDDPPISRYSALALMLGCLPGMAYSHPGAVFALGYCAVPLAAAWVGRSMVVAQPRHRWFWGLGGLVLAGGFWLAWRVADRMSSLEPVRTYNWKAIATPDTALGWVIGLGSRDNLAVWVMGFLVVVGFVAALSKRVWWLALVHAMFATLAILAFAYDTETSQAFTGFWYNDPNRMAAIMGISAVTLAAVGAVHLRDAMARGLSRGLGDGWHAPLAASLIVALAVMWALPGRMGLAKISEAVKFSYSTNPQPLISNYEVGLYEQLAKRVRPGDRIAGNPWGGAVYAGVLTNTDALIRVLNPRLDPDRQLVAERFSHFQSDPQVCAAVKRLRITYVVEDESLSEPGSEGARSYPGLTELEGTPGLKKVARSGTATAWAVGSCTS